MVVEHDVPTAGEVGRILQHLQSQLDERRIKNWFASGSTRMEWRSGALCIYAASPYLIGWIQRQFQAALEDAARLVGGPAARVQFEIDNTLNPATPRDVPRAIAPGVRSVPRTTPAPAAPRRQSPPLYDLRRFVRGACNELALTAVQSLIEYPDTCPNPIYLHGGVGCGKTHLLEGLREGLQRKHSSLQVLALTSEEFANLFTQALDSRSLPSFRQKFRNVDILLVDDVDFFDGKRVIQEEFLHTVKQLARQRRQIVVTADRHPRLLSRSNDELLSLYQSGIVCRIEAPDAATRLTVVKQLADRMKLNATHDALEFVASRFTRNVRELEGAVHFLGTWQQANESRITVSTARDALAALVRDCVKIVRLADVEHAVCNLFGLPPDELRSAKRQRSVSEPRMLAMYLSRRLTQAAYTEIGGYFGGRNHSTVMSAERKINDLVKSRASVRIAAQDWPMSELVATLEQQLKAV
ncbi:MAG: chromosomal replication initiator protein DnaA [Planctomyces sp.]|nr:chromosomal replication initiator protein DnaA [Planctomyces sp.]